MTRRTDLQRFLDAMLAAYESSSDRLEIRERVEKLRLAFATVGGASAHQAVRLPVCCQLGDALYFRSREKALLRAAQEFATIERALLWRDDEAGSDRCAHACILGPDGLEQRDDVIVGATLMAPYSEFRAPSRAAETIYLVFSSGAVQADDGPWTTPGIGRTVYVEPHVKHALRSGDTAFFALWFGWPTFAAQEMSGAAQGV